MKIDLSEEDLLPLRNIIEQAHDQISEYPVVKNKVEGFESLRDQYIESQRFLRKLYRKLTKALEKSSIGHGCNASAKMQMP